MNVNASGRGTRNRSNRSWWGAPVGLAAGADGDEYQRPTMTKETTMTTKKEITMTTNMRISIALCLVVHCSTPSRCYHRNPNVE